MTLTTTGYGDITPVAPFARSLAAMESIIGVLHVAVVIDRFAGSIEDDRPSDETA